MSPKRERVRLPEAFPGAVEPTTGAIGTKPGPTEGAASISPARAGPAAWAAIRIDRKRRAILMGEIVLMAPWVPAGHKGVERQGNGPAYLGRKDPHRNW